MERITARKNPLLQQVRRLLNSRREREQAGLFVADGTKLLSEAVRWWPGLETVISKFPLRQRSLSIISFSFAASRRVTL